MLSAFVFITFITLSTPTAYACSCSPPGPSVLSYFDYDAVFSGRVVNIVNPEPRGNIVSSADPVNINFEVYKSYKGVDGKSVAITTALSGASCGYDFEKDKEYLVYAYKDNNDNLSVSLCSNTSLLSESQKDIVLFNTLFFLGPVSPILLLLVALFIGYRIVIHFRKKSVS